MEVLPPIASSSREFRELTSQPLDDDEHGKGGRQLLIADIYKLMRPRLPKDAHCMAALTMYDLYSRGYNFLYGQAKMKERLGVFSFARYDPAFYGEPRAAGARGRLLWASCHVMNHEIGHMFNFLHCVYFRCRMNGANDIDEAARCRPTSAPSACASCSTRSASTRPRARRARGDRARLQRRRARLGRLRRRRRVVRGARRGAGCGRARERGPRSARRARAPRRARRRGGRRAAPRRTRARGGRRARDGRRARGGRRAAAAPVELMRRLLGAVQRAAAGPPEVADEARAAALALCAEVLAIEPGNDLVCEFRRTLARAVDGAGEEADDDDDDDEREDEKEEEAEPPPLAPKLRRGASCSRSFYEDDNVEVSEDEGDADGGGDAGSPAPPSDEAAFSTKVATASGALVTTVATGPFASAAPPACRAALVPCPHRTEFANLPLTSHVRRPHPF